MVGVKCKKCNKEFKAYPSRIKKGWGKFCSKECYKEENYKRLTMSGEKTRYSGGHVSASKLNPSIMRRGKNHPLWKSEKVGYRGLHYWVRRILGVPIRCKHCKKGVSISRKIDWANIDHKYRRKAEDYIPLCKSCHKIFDLKKRKLSTE